MYYVCTYYIRLRLEREVLLLLLSARLRNCDPAVAVGTTVDVTSAGGGEMVDIGGCGLVGVSSALLPPDELGWLGEPESLELASCVL